MGIYWQQDQYLFVVGTQGGAENLCTVRAGDGSVPMIKNDREKQRKLQEIKQAELLMTSNRELLTKVGLQEAEIQQHITPTLTLVAQWKKEVEEYDRLKTGQLPEEEPIQRIGEFLVKLRISKGLTQKALADQIEVDETMVSRDERNLYKGVSIERLFRVIEALGVQVDVKATDLSEPTNVGDMAGAMV
jgi:hypothetical protein